MTARLARSCPHGYTIGEPCGICGTGVAAAAVVCDTDTAGNTVWRLQFPAPAKILSINTAKHWRVTSPNKKTWRQAMYTYAHHAHLPTNAPHIRVDVHIQFPTGARRDPPNYHPYVAKPIVDALGPGRTYTSRSAGVGRVTEPGYGLIADDDPTHLDGPHITIGPPVGRLHGYGVITVTITIPKA